MRSLLYVSRSALIVPEDEWQVQAIVDAARSRNKTLGVTGALMFTEVYFAQWLEGDAAAVEALMASIRKDDRHHAIRIVRDLTGGARRFTNWSLAFAGPALFMGEAVEAVAEGRYEEQDVQRLADTMASLAA